MKIIKTIYYLGVAVFAALFTLWAVAMCIRSLLNGFGDVAILFALMAAAAYCLMYSSCVSEYRNLKNEED